MLFVSHGKTVDGWFDVHDKRATASEGRVPSLVSIVVLTFREKGLQGELG